MEKKEVKKDIIKDDNKEEIKEFLFFGDENEKDNQNNNDKSLGSSDSISKNKI